MEILTPDEFAAKFDFRRPIKEPPPEEHGAWPIPFEYGKNANGTRISIAMAKTIAAELRAEVAEAENREVLRAFKQEQERSAEALKQSASLAFLREHDLRAEIEELKRILRSKKRRPFFRKKK
jgi:hypothetical protein